MGGNLTDEEGEEWSTGEGTLNWKTAFFKNHKIFVI